jgi:hypothetical protein
MIKGLARAMLERSGLRKSRTDKLTAHQIDDRCNQFNAPWFDADHEPDLTVCGLQGTGGLVAKTGRRHSAKLRRWG